MYIIEKFRRIKFLLSIVASLSLLVIFLIQDAHADTYTYYPSGLLESKTLTKSDEYGNLYYHYLNENWNNQGYGRLDKQVRASPDNEGAIAYEYGYYPGTSTLKAKYCYKNADYTNPSNPIFTNLLVTYGYYPSGLMSTKTLANGTIYAYSDENFNSEGYGLLIKETKPDGSYKVFSGHYPGIRQWRYIKEYDATDKLLATYEYDRNGNFIGRVDSTKNRFSFVPHMLRERGLLESSGFFGNLQNR